MNRRRFVTVSGAAAAASLASGPVSAATPGRALMKLGCQSAPTNDTHLKYLARYGVRNICGYPEIAGDRIYATVDELKQMRERGPGGFGPRGPGGRPGGGGFGGPPPGGGGFGGPPPGGGGPPPPPDEF